MPETQDPEIQNSQELGAAPLYERMQDLVFRVDVESGGKIFRIGMFCVLVLAVVLLYAGVNFYGMRDLDAMDSGQLARNLWRGQGYKTQFIRPLDLWHLKQINKPTLTAERTAIPEMWRPPMYPLVLSVLFHILHPDFSMGVGKHTLAADRVMMYAGVLFFLVGLVLMYLLARALFDQRVALLASFLYLFCDPLLDHAIAGLAMGFLTVLFMLLVYAVLKAERWEMDQRPSKWVVGALAVSGLLVGIGTLTEYAFVSVLLPLLIYIGVSFPRRRLVGLLVCVGVFGMILAPWVLRNIKVSRTWFGLTSYAVRENTFKGLPEEVLANQLQRTYRFGEDNLEIPPLTFRLVLRKSFLNLRQLFEETVMGTGGSFMIAFFLVALVHRFRLAEVFRLRRFVFWSMLTCLLWLSVSGIPKRNFLVMFMPLIIIYGAAFFFVVFERLQFRTRLLRWGTIGLFVFLNSIPFVFAVLPPKTTLPYPPYDAGIGTAVGTVFHEEEAMMSDIPWALAWYADRPTVWLPMDVKDFVKINDEVRVISAIYVTQVSLEDISVQEMLAAKKLFWIGLFQPPAQNFPLHFFNPLTPDRQQVILSNRNLDTKQ